MKGRLLLLLLTLFIALPSFAQKQNSNHESKRQQMLDIKLKFLGDEIEIDDSKRKQFNDLYTQMETERRAAYKKIKAAEKIIKETKNASEADYDRATKEISNAKNQLTQIEQTYTEKFSKFLSKKQLYKLKEAEDKFKDIVRKCRDKKKQNK